MIIDDDVTLRRRLQAFISQNGDEAVYSIRADYLLDILEEKQDFESDLARVEAELAEAKDELSHMYEIVEGDDELDGVVN